MPPEHRVRTLEQAAAFVIRPYCRVVTQSLRERLRRSERQILCTECSATVRAERERTSQRRLSGARGPTTRRRWGWPDAWRSARPNERTSAWSADPAAGKTPAANADRAGNASNRKALRISVPFRTRRPPARAGDRREYPALRRRRSSDRRRHPPRSWFSPGSRTQHPGSRRGRFATVRSRAIWLSRGGRCVRQTRCLSSGTSVCAIGKADQLRSRHLLESCEQVHQRLGVLVGALQIARMNELVPEPGIFATVERLHGPVDHMLNPGNFFRVGMIGEPDVEIELDVDVERYQRVAERRHIGGQPSDARAFGDRPQMRGGDIVAHRHEADLLATGGVSIVHLLGLGLLGVLKDYPVVLPDV